MRIGINAQRLSGQRLGVGRYLEYLFRHWGSMLEPSERLSIYLRERAQEGSFVDGPQFETNVLKPGLSRFFWEQTTLAGKIKGLDVFFGPSYTLPLAYPGRCVVAIHSVNETRAGSHPWWYLAYQQLYRRSAQKARVVIVPSHSTRLDLMRAYRIAGEKVEVVPQGADDAFQPISDQQLLKETRKRLIGEDRPYILFVGKISQRRNIPMLLEAFALMKKRTKLPHALLLFGPNHLNLPLEDLAERLGISRDVVQTDGLVADHKDLVAVYNAADVFVHPSAYEGWSMTTMEALACGVAVIAANRGGLGEVVNGHALSLDEISPGTIASAMEHVLTDDNFRRELQAKARKRGSAFRWEDTCRDTLAVVRRVAAA